MQLHTLYSAILASLNAITDKEGLVSLENGDEHYPCMVDNRRLAIPTRDLLRRGAWEEHGLQPFHPLSEHLSRGESPVLKKLRLLIQVRLASVYEGLLMLLTDLAADKRKHKTIAPKAAAILQVMPDADEKTLHALEKILDAAMKDPGNVVKVFLRRGAMYDGVKAPRVCFIRFPLLEEFEGEEPTVYGVKLRKKDYVQLKALLEYVTPKADVTETYGAASVSTAAPYFDALVRAYIKTAKHFNGLIWLYRKHVDNETDAMMELDWADDFEDLDKHRNDIPSLSGNEGELLTAESAGVQRGAAVVESESYRPKRNLMEAAANTSHVTANAAQIERSYMSPTAAREAIETPPTSTPERDEGSSTFKVGAVSQAIHQPVVPQLAQQPMSQHASGGHGRSFSELMAHRQQSFNQHPAPVMHHPAPAALPPGRFAPNVSTPYQQAVGYMAGGTPPMWGNGWGPAAIPGQFQPPGFGQGPYPQNFGTQQV